MAPNEVNTLGQRVGALETSVALVRAEASATMKNHETDCNGRYAMINAKQNIQLIGIGLIFMVLLGGSPVASALQRIFSGAPH